MQINLRRTIVLAVFLSCCCALVAQDAPPASKAKSSPKAASPMSMPVVTAAPEMTKMIKMMAGNWTVSEKEFPGPMMPNGGTGKGTATLTAGPGSLSLIEKYHSTGAMGPNFTGYGTFWWDPKIQAYHGVWCDNMTPGGCDASGITKWDGDKLVGTMKAEMDGKMMVTRFTYSDWKPTSFVMTMDMGPDENSLKPALTITYTKTAGSAMADASEKMKK
jgi:hypothetical protein